MAPTVLLVLALLLSLASLPAAKENVALNRPVTAAGGWSSPSLANDGTVGLSSVDNCFHSADLPEDRPGWWRVDLGAVYPMDDVTIHFYFDGGVDRSSGTAVYVQNSTGTKELCTTITEATLQNKDVSCPQTGQFLELRKTESAYTQLIALCEIQVFVSVCSDNCALGTCVQADGACNGGCKAGWWGSTCVQSCSNNCAQVTCRQADGACDGGCKAGFWGSTCVQSCSNNCAQGTCRQADGACNGGCKAGFWGSTCVQSCSIYCAQTACALSDGACDGGCKAGWWGTKCDQPCSINCAQGTCVRSDGTCDGGCKAGWRGTKCDLPCEAGTFGAGCAGVCGHCPCDHVTGACTRPCASGWRGTLCNETCQAGKYGAGCGQTCGQCLQGTCHHESGNCNGGCQPGWTALKCDQMCGNGTYGNSCALKCGECLQQPCHHVNGSCFGGCQSGKTGDLCKEVCPVGTFGLGCLSKCGHCVGVACLDNGDCPGPCQDGWTGAACNQTCSAGSYGNNCSNTCGSCRDNATCNHVTGNCPEGCSAGWDGTRCLQAVPVQSPDNNMAATIGGAVGGSLAVILVLVVVVLTVFLLRRKRQQKGPSEVRGRGQRLTKRKESLSTVEDVPGYYNVALKETPASNGKPAVKARKPKGQDEGNDVRDDYYNVGSFSRHSNEAGIPVASFPDHVKSMKTEKKFQPEYESVSSDFLKPYTISQMKEHAGKNKFKTYYPYDDNRVVLDLVAGDPNTHYINASHVDGFDAPKAFIAAQAPTKVTLPDFLRMIWQQHCSHVVMLANLWEEGRAKCERYFPEHVGEDLTAGEITVTLAQETTASFCIVRLLTFSHKNGESRTIRQFHFTTWPDHGVPTHVDMLDFFWKVRASWTPASGPLLVHCSAGVGRTGTFIGLCLLSDQAASQHRVDPLATLTALRQQRRNMIQTLDQYEFLHEVLERVLEFGRTAVTKTVFADHYRRLQGSTFMGTKTLDQIKQALPSLCVARKVEKFQTFDDSNVYSNTWNYQDAALHLSSVRLSSGCVQVRLCEAGQEDVAPKGLWSFLSRVSCSVLVDVHSAQKACVRQPGEAGEVEDGALTVQWQAPADLASGVTLRSVLVKDENKETQVTYLSYNWRKASQGLVPAVSHLCNLQLSASPSPVTFIFRDAEDEQTANLLCACLNVAEAILMDSEVELVNNILRVKATFSPEMVVQCAEFAKTFMQVTDVYANA